MPKSYRLRILIILSIVSVICISSFLCISSHQQYAQLKKENRYGGTLVWGTRNPPSIINPIVRNPDSSAALVDLMFNGLVRMNSEGQVTPDLASSWDVSEDGLEYIFHLRKGVRFHDGVELTAESVKFTYELIQDPKNESRWRTNIELIEVLEVVDPHTLKITLKEPFPTILSKLTHEIIPKHLWKDQNLKVSPFNYKPVGTGPFKFHTWDQAINQIELIANLDYFEGRPYLDKVVLKSYTDNEELWAAFMRQEIDFIKFINRNDYLIIKDDPSFKAYEIPVVAYLAIAYDLNNQILSDINVRKAIAHGIDRERLISATVGGGGIKSSGPFPPGSAGFNPDVKPFTYNPKKAQRLLAQTDWKDVDEDGILEKGGEELEIKMLVDARGKIYSKLAAIIRQNLSELGIKIKIHFYQDNNQLSKNYAKKIQAQAWLRFFFGFKTHQYEISKEWYSLSSEFGKLWAYKNTEVDRLFKQIQTIKDESGRILLYQKLHQIIYDEQPVCFLLFPVTYHSISAKFANIEAFFTWDMPGHVIKDWYIQGKT